MKNVKQKPDDQQHRGITIVKNLFCLLILLLAGCASSGTKQDARTDEERAEIRAVHIMHGHAELRE
jgi:hypothetical protein